VGVLARLCSRLIEAAGLTIRATVSHRTAQQPLAGLPIHRQWALWILPVSAVRSSRRASARNDPAASPQAFVAL
jgi:hypothetical protein